MSPGYACFESLVNSFYDLLIPFLHLSHSCSFFAWRREAAAGASWWMLAWTPGSEPCKSSIELSLTLRIDFQCLFLPRVMSASTQTKAWADGKVQEGAVPAGGPPDPPVLRLYPPGRRALILTFLFFQELIVQFLSLIIVLKKFLRKF